MYYNGPEPSVPYRGVSFIRGVLFWRIYIRLELLLDRVVDCISSVNIGDPGVL